MRGCGDFCHRHGYPPAGGRPRGGYRRAGRGLCLGQDLLARLTSGKLYVCAAAGAEMPQGKAANIEVAQFAGRTRLAWPVPMSISWRASA